VIVPSIAIGWIDEPPPIDFGVVAPTDLVLVAASHAVDHTERVAACKPGDSVDRSTVVRTGHNVRPRSDWLHATAAVADRK
jgi:hypothetical protein